MLAVSQTEIETVERTMRVPYALSVSDEEEVAAVVEVLRTSTLPGPKVHEFEEKIAALFGKSRGVMVNSGSSALLLGIAAMDLPKGSEVITPALTFSTTVASQVQNGLVPAFVDVDPQTLNIRVDQVEEMITPNTRAMVIPNLMGNIPDWDALRAIADRHGLLVLEDSADTLDTKLHGRPTGERADICTTSFYGAHIINCAGNGGMLCTNSEELEHRSRILRGWGRRSSVFAESESANARFGIEIDGIPYDAKYVFDMIGYNFEPSELGAAFGLVQYRKLPGFLKSRQATFDRHKAFFQRYEEFFLLPEMIPGADVTWYAFPLVVRDDAPFHRNEMQMYLEDRGIQTRPVFTGNILRQPGFKTIARRESVRGYPDSDLVTRGGIVIGCHQGLSEAQVSHIYETAASFLKAKTGR
ncbi:DegT/DnrJ/EryC1/StrS aminotransferase family protein [Sphingomonas sp. LaA6.9]|uniref:DegT/DnrJ/EryC1/StrS family aminotransferase n=1 Tax=Sphingomonas sp. LaA6.9 TaxID=2919914 RepID=UPI001F4F3E22|nr:aminotransferase class I/II-fold pyridoxal phosphate-dependent enzyme [Sphingomonas sp. LaA6.9]MCJ8159302.1 aminotransferase class I/II-fold pyridoxal phosphate-dependent enzyme [Sphingomonas sp. LaA6.9]